MQEEFIKDYNTRRTIGILRTQANGDQVAIDFVTRRVLGYYRKQFDHTTDFLGRILSKGNSVVTLIYQNQSK